MACLPGGHRFDSSLLREYDIRGVYGKTLHEADAYAVGRSFATILRCGLHEPGETEPGVDPVLKESPVRVVVGRDGRLSSPALEQSLIEGLVEGGVDVLRLGIGPSPMVYFAQVSTEGVEGGIQVTGSHNPRDHNGFKFVVRDRPFFGEQLLWLGEIAAAGNWTTGQGRVEDFDVVPAYVSALRGALCDADADTLAQLRIGWDAGNGAAGPVIERLTVTIAGEHHLLFSTVDGRFPNHHPDPTLEENLADLRALVASRNLDFGVAFDGDGDRLGVIDGLGRVIWADQLLAIFVADVLQEHPGARIVGDVKMSQATFDAIERAGGVAVMAPSGHSHIKARMKETGAVLGGEMSGHIFFADRWFGFDDGIYAALRLIALVVRSGRSLAAIRNALPQTFATPELRFAVPAARLRAVVREVAERLRKAGQNVQTIDGLRVSGPDGWWLLRASNTQDMLTARAEGTSAESLERLVAELDDELRLSGIVRSVT